MKVVNSANIHTTASATLFVIAFNLFLGDTLNNNKMWHSAYQMRQWIVHGVALLSIVHACNLCSIEHLSDDLSDRDSHLRSQNLALPPGRRDSTSTMPSRAARYIRLQDEARGA